LGKIVRRSREGYAEVMRLKLSVHQKGTKRRKQRKKTCIGVRKRDELVFGSETNIKKKMMKNWSC
jgi:hypothetical protein